MKRYYLQKVVQRDVVFYSLIINPTIIATMLDFDESQPLSGTCSKKRIDDIVCYVRGSNKDNIHDKLHGVIPNSIVINVMNDLKVEKEESNYYIDLPDNKEEFSNYRNTIQVLDGYHQLMSFHPTVNVVKDYEMIFCVFDHMPTKLKQEIFLLVQENKIINSEEGLRARKQRLEIVHKNDKLDCLIQLLNTNNESPLFNRIMDGTEVIVKGYRYEQIRKILDKSGTFSELSKASSDKNIQFKILSNYFKAWEELYHVTFKDPQKDILTKISGIRYILYLYPVIQQILIKNKDKASIDGFKEVITMLPQATGISNVFTDETAKLSFRGEGGIVQMARMHKDYLKDYEASIIRSFDITNGL